MRLSLAHFCEMFVGVPPCVTLFRHFFSVRCSGRSSTEIGRYYFLLKGSGGRSTYLPTFASAKWEHWRNDWVIIRAEPNDRLALPDSSPDAPLPEGASTDLPPEFSPVLARIAELVSGGLTSLHVLADFLRRRLAPLQMRPRPAWNYTGPNDCSRGSTWRRPRPDAAPAGGMGAALRTAVLWEMPTLDDGGLAARQLGGDPNRGVHIADAPVGGSGARGTAPADKGKEPVAASPAVPPAGGEETRRRLVRGDGTFVSEPDPKRQRTSGEGTKAALCRGASRPKGLLPGAAPDCRTSEPSSPAAQTTSPGSPPPTEGELEEVLGRPLLPLPQPGGAPLPRVLRRAHQALDDAQEALPLEWARLQQEREGLDGWRARLGEQIEAATAQHSRTRAELSTARTELDADRAAFQEDLQRLAGRERAVGLREKQAEVGEARLKLEQAKLESAWKGVEQRRQELVEVSERQAAVNSELDKMKLRLVEREAAVAAREDSVAQREASAKALRDSAARQAATLKVREDWVKSREAELAEQERQLLAERAALEKLKQGAAQQAAVEDREQMRAGLQRIADWAGEASSALVPLGLSPIRVTEPPSTMADALPVLDSAVGATPAPGLHTRRTP
ncbi:hypothetical protein BS78_K339700 [Paspalum vaginatum]|uniref:Transposase (putative) gypsy type domain-containing protein n=1 Tax=Paspalum vaginatum TaxID=158149 RepID=A0A9W7X7I9_9POAL|nr:hypothetical protein BS78_K339700 [Paspalum vaginatum]